MVVTSREERCAPRRVTGVAAASEETPNGRCDAKRLRHAVARAQFVRRCAESLLLDTAVTATAVLFVQQFYAARSESQFDHHVIGGACLFLATKSCEVPRTLRSVVNVVHAVMNDTTEPLGADAAYSNLKNSLINAEQTVLRVLRFDIDVVLPHAFLLNYARHLNLSESTVHCALALANDVLCSPEGLAFPPTAIAASCLLLASRIMQDDTSLDMETKWWYRYDTSDSDVQEIAQLVERIHDAVDAVA